MIHRIDDHLFDRRLSAWLEDEAGARSPDYLADVLGRIDGIGQRHTRVSVERWLPMSVITARRAGAPWRLLWVGLVLTLITSLALTSIVLVGSNVLPSVLQTSDDNAGILTPAPPTGPARNGLIAFAQDGDIWVIEPDGSNPRPFVATPELDGPAVWSPDGTRLAFWSFAFDGDVDDKAAVEAAMADPDVLMSVNVVRADGTDRKVLLSGIRWASPCGTDLSWAHDIERLAVSYTNPDEVKPVPTIEILSSDGDPLGILAFHGVDPSWSPDDRTIAYHGLVNPNDLRLVASDGTDDGRHLTTVPGSGCAFDGSVFSPDGSQVAFYGGADGAHDVWVADVDGGGEVRLSEDLADEYWPRWSPDGSRIAFDRVVDPANNAPQFVVSDPDGGNQAMLEHPPVAARYPTWSPDGGSILGMLLSDDHTEIVGLLLVDAAGVDAPIELYRGLVLDPTWQRLAP